MKFDFANCSLETDTLSLTRNGEVVAVEPQVFDLLLLLARNAGRVVTKDEIIDVVWQGRIVSESAISARIAAARKAVGDDGKAQRIIQTVARRGLKLVADLTAEPDQRTSERDEIPPIRYTRNAEGKSLAYALTGQGPPVVRSGYGYTDLEAEWALPAERTVFDAISERATLLRFDPIGTGQSDLDLTEIDYAAEADDLIRCADAAGFDRFALYSESGGVHTALHAAAAYPDRISRLAIAGGYVEGRMLRREDAEPDPIRGLIQEAWSSSSESFAIGYLAAYFPDGPLEAIQRIANLMISACPQENILLRRDAINWISTADLLPRVRCPTLVLHSKDDRIHPLSEGRKLASGIPDASLVVLDTANHVPQPGNVAFDTFLTTITDFLTG